HDNANSGIVVLPTNTAPAVLAFWATGSSSVCTGESASSCEPNVVTIPEILVVSLNAIGNPCNGPTTPVEAEAASSSSARANAASASTAIKARSEEHTSELQSRFDLVCRLLL